MNGADYLIENGRLYRSTGTGWSWSYIKRVTVDLRDNSTVQATIEKSDLQNLSENINVISAFINPDNWNIVESAEESFVLGNNNADDGAGDARAPGLAHRLGERLRRRYLTSNATDPQLLDKATHTIIQQVEALKTKGLKAGYNGILKALQDHTGRSLENAVKVALEERSRYYALRIAATETARSSRLSEAYGYLTDEGIELVRYQMNPTHPFPDICDALAKADFGYGPGIYPKDKMVALPAHPFCGCRYYPIYSGRKKKPGKFSGWETALRNMKPYEQVRALGSREAWLEWKSGTPAEEIWNSKRPRYPVAPVKDYLPVE